MAESGSWKRITIHTDGGCDGNPGPGGWAALLRYGDHVRELTGGEPATTNNRMELQGAISALKSLKESCEVTLFTDSEYLRGGITEWLPRWQANHWRTADRKAVKNDDLWRQLQEAGSQNAD
jgi:ribonuclease HI